MQNTLPGSESGEEKRRYDNEMELTPSYRRETLIVSRENKYEHTRAHILAIKQAPILIS